MVDLCGIKHESGLYYKWDVLSLWNEDEHHLGAVQYTTCFDAVTEVLAEINPTIELQGPEICGWAAAPPLGP